jgi:hypothetical protein
MRKMWDKVDNMTEHNRNLKEQKYENIWGKVDSVIENKINLNTSRAGAAHMHTYRHVSHTDAAARRQAGPRFRTFCFRDGRHGSWSSFLLVSLVLRTYVNIPPRVALY